MSENRRTASFWFTTLSSASRIRSGWRAACPGSRSERRPARRPPSSPRGSFRHLRHERHMEDAAASRHAVALGPHRPAHRLGETLRDRKPETRAAVAPADRDVGLAERLEQAIHAIGRDADAGVAHDDVELEIIVLADRRCGREELDASLVRELHRVVEHIEHDLTEASGIAENRPAARCVDLCREREPLPGGDRADRARARRRCTLGSRTAHLELYPAGLDLREVEDVVDDR